MAWPLLAGLLASTAVSKIGESQGWNPVLTGILSTVAGAGVGSIGAGIGAASGVKAGAGAAMSTGQLAHSVFNPTMVGLPASYNAAVLGPAVSGSLPTPHVSSNFIGGPNLWNPGSSVPANEFVGAMTPKVPYNAAAHANYTYPQKFASMTPSQGAAQAWKNTWSNPNFQYAMGAQVIDGLFAEPPRRQSLGGGGGGGGGGSAPAYQGGGGGQYQLIQSFPQRGTSIQWQEVA